MAGCWQRGAVGVGRAAALTVEGPGLIDCAVWRQKSSITVHLVNLTNPISMKGPFREIIPVASQKIRFRCAAPPKSAKFLVAGTPRSSHTAMAGWRLTRLRFHCRGARA